MSRKYLGLDIQSDALCAVILESGVKNRSVTSCARIPLQPPELTREALTVAFHRLIDEMDVEGCASVVSVPMERAVYRNLQVPFSDTKKIRQVLPGEIESSLPFPIETLVIDFQKIKASDNAENIIAVAAKAAELALFLEAAGECRIDPETLLPGAYATGIRLTAASDMPEDWLLLDVQPLRCGIIVTHSRKICLLRTFPLSLAAGDSATTLCRQLHQTIAGIDSILGTHFLPDSIWVTGPGADAESLHNCISETLQLPVYRLDLFDKTGIRKNETAFPNLLPLQMNNALACALLAAEGARGGLNLRQGVLAAKSRFLEYKQTILRSCLIVGLAVFLAFANLVADIYILERKSTRIKNEMVSLFKSVLPDIRVVVEPVHQMQIEIDALKKKGLAAADSQNYLPAIDALFLLSRDVPETIDVRFSKLVIGDQSILISGSTDSFNSVNEMKSGFEKNKLFKIVKINSADMEQAEKRVRFKIQIQL